MQGYDKNKKARVCNAVNIAVFCSGNGSNFQAIVDASKKGLFRAKVALMVCDNPEAYAIKRAEKENVRSFIIDRADFPSKQEFEERIMLQLEKEKIGLICLAGYMRMLSPGFVKRYKGRILNIHPAILPLFKGSHGIRDALDYGVKVTGVTVHFVNEDMDAGPVILQETVKIDPADTEDTLAEKIHNIEHRLYPEAIRLFTERRLKIIGRRVNVLTVIAVIFMVFGFSPKAVSDREVSSALLPGAKAAFFREAPPPLPIGTKKIFCKEKPHAFSLKEKALPLITGHNTALEKDLRPDLAVYDKLELTVPAPYNIWHYADSDHTQPLNPYLNIERPATEEELGEMRIKGSLKIARTFAEILDSMNAGVACEGMNSLISAATRIMDFRNYMGNGYNLHFKLDKEKALLRYKRSF